MVLILRCSILIGNHDAIGLAGMRIAELQDCIRVPTEQSD